MRKHKRPHNPAVRSLETAVLIALPILFHYVIPIKTMISKPYTYLGIVVMLLGLALMTWVSILFRRVGTGFQLQEGGTVLVTSGPFRISRNPMYLGMLVWLIGLAALLGSLVSFLFPILFFLLVNTFVIPLEERHMERQFGNEYRQFTRRTRRWL